MYVRPCEHVSQLLALFRGSYGIKGNSPNDLCPKKYLIHLDRRLDTHVLALFSCLEISGEGGSAAAAAAAGPVDTLPKLNKRSPPPPEEEEEEEEEEEGAIVSDRRIFLPSSARPSNRN